MKKISILLPLLFLLWNTIFGQPSGNFITMSGSTDHISVPDQPFMDLPGDFTLSVKANFAVNKWHMLLTHHGGAAPQGFEFSYTGSTIRLSPDGYQYCIDAPWTATLNTWYQISVTRKGNLFSAYVNGVLVGTSTFAGAIGADSDPLRIGNYYVPGYHFMGKMDDVSIWSEALGPSQLVAMSSGELTGTEPNLVAYYNMNRSGQGSGLTVSNLSSSGGLFNGITVGTSSTPYFTQVSQPAGALDFDGVDDYVDMGDYPLTDFGNNNFTVEFWAYKKSPTNNWNAIALGKWNTGGSPGTNEWAVSLANNITGDIPSFALESGSSIKVLSSQIAINVGQWWHIACVRESNFMKMYINGQPAGSLDIGPNFNINNVGRTFLMGKLAAGYNSPIKLDDTRIWNRALCQEEILERMNCQLTGTETGLVAYYRFNQGLIGENNAGQTTLNDASPNGLNGSLINFAQTGNTSNWTAGTVSGTCSATNITCPPSPAQLYGPDLWLKADAGVVTNGSNVTTWQDQSGNNRHASATGNIQLVSNGNNGNPVIRFTGNQGLNTPAFQTFPAKRGTIFVVSKSATSGTGGGGYGTLVSTFTGSSPSWQFGAFPNTYGFYDGAGCCNVFINPAIDPAKWGLVTLVRDANTNLDIFHNGALNNSLPINDNQPAMNVFKIGWNGSSETFRGDIAEIIVYGRALSAPELQQVTDYLANKYVWDGPAAAPSISLSRNSIDYGNLGLGFSLEEKVIITNTGTAPLNISGITSTHPAYTISYSKNTLAPNDTTHLLIKYNPSSAGSTAATINIAHNATGSPSSVSVTGNAFGTGFTFRVNQIPGFLGTLRGASWFNGRRGFVSGANGKLFCTEDGGDTWREIPLGTTETIHSIRSIGSGLWIFGSNGLICVSYDGGQSFTPFNTGTSSIFYDGYFINGFYGFAGGSNGTLCRYNGTGWQPYNLGLSNNFYGIYAYGNTAWAVGSGGIVCRYNAGTDSWVPVNPGISGDLLGVGFWNENIGYVTGRDGVIYRTLNGGNNWIACNSGVTSNITGIKCGSATLAWATCDDGTVLQTTDGGNTWVKLPLGGFNFERVDFNDCQGIAICHNGAVVTFQTNLCNNSYNPYYIRRSTGTGYGFASGWYGSRTNGGIGGNYGSVLFTTDGGKNWYSTNPFTTSHIYSLRIFGNTSFIAGSGGYIAKCNRLGTNWVRFNGIPSHITFYSMSFYANGTGWAVGSGGTICYYNGTGWVPYNTGGIQNTFRCVYVIGNVAYAAGTNGIIWKYDGNAWIDVSPGVGNDFYGCAFVSPLVGYAVGSGGIICKTTNGGQSWFPVTSPTTEDLKCVEVACSLEAMMAGDNGAAFQTSDGGNTWEDRSLQRPVTISSIALLEGEGLLTADNGEVYSFAFGAGKVTGEITAGGPTTFCEGGSVTLTASGGSNYAWSTGETTASINVSQSGTYKVVVGNAVGCTDEKEITVTVNPNPVISFQPPAAICKNAAPITLTATPAGGNFSGTGVSGNQFNPAVAGVGTYLVTYTYTNENGCTAAVEKSIVVNAAPTVNAGSNQTVYYGYAPMQCATLSGSASGGTPAYSFAWSNGSNTAQTNVCPVVTTQYTLSVTDQNNCSGSSNVTVNVVDVRCGPNGRKVTVCHVADKKTVEICVDAHAVPAHLAHGDKIGRCSTPSPKGMITVNEQPESSIDKVQVFPNPSKGKITLQFTENTTEKTISIIDLNGKTLESSKLQIGHSMQMNYEIKTVRNGIILLKISGLNGIQTEKLVIQQ